MCLFYLVSGDSQVWYKHPVLEDHWYSGWREDGEASVTEEHSDRR